MIRLSIREARELMLAAQGLTTAPRRRATPDDVIAVIRRMGALQIDSISVVARSPYLVLWSRLGSYYPSLLDDLLATGQIFEYWSHAACFLPIEDAPLYFERMTARESRHKDWMTEKADLLDAIRERIREDGALRSADWERTDGRRSSGWWDWKPEKVALEILFSSGHLTVTRRENFQRVYDLTERVYPHWAGEPRMSEEENLRAFIGKTVKALGVATAQWIPGYFGLRSVGVAAQAKALSEEGVLIPATIGDWSTPAFVHRDLVPIAQLVTAGKLRSTVTTLLSPFDPMVWDRKRAEKLFDFNYRIETYTPSEKRRFGYFTLPILRRGVFVGRLDPKAHRKEGVLEVRAVHVEDGVRVTAAMRADVEAALTRFATWQGLDRVETTGPDAFDLFQ